MRARQCAALLDACQRASRAPSVRLGDTPSGARPGAPEAHDRMAPAVRTERSHRGLVRRFAKPLSGATCSEGSNPSLSASIRSAIDAPVAQWIEHLVADQKVVSSSLAGRARTTKPCQVATSPHRRTAARARPTGVPQRPCRGRSPARRAARRTRGAAPGSPAPGSRPSSRPPSAVHRTAAARRCGEHDQLALYGPGRSSHSRRRTPGPMDCSRSAGRAR